VRVVSGSYHVVGSTDVSVQRTGGGLEELVKQFEGDAEDILLWPQNETSDTPSGTADGRALQTLTCTFKVFSFLANSESITAKKLKSKTARSLGLAYCDLMRANCILCPV